MNTSAVYYGALVNPESQTALSAHPRALMAVNKEGIIEWVEEDVDSSMVQDFLAGKGLLDVDVVELKHGQFLMPGFVDTHTHAPQVPNIGSGQQYELLDWLDNVTFPMEARFADADFARAVYPAVVRRFINSGTTTCCYFATLHVDSSKILADVALHQGQRAFIGKCNMNRNSPAYYCESSTDVSMNGTHQLIEYIRSLKSPLVRPILTPRFAISCSPDLLRDLGKLAKDEPTLAIQSHISENKSEVAFVHSLFPDCGSYAQVYDKYDLLCERTILAHGVHLTEEEMILIKERGAGVSHCPTSNFNLKSGLARVGKMLDLGLKVGLGTDVSGGFSISMLTAIQDASACSKMVHVHLSDDTGTQNRTKRFTNRPLSIPTLLYLATVGGAELCCLQDEIGRLKAGMSFDAIIATVRPEAGNPRVWSTVEDFTRAPDKKKLEAYLEKFLFGGDDRNIENVFVKGRLIGGRTFKAT